MKNLISIFLILLSIQSCEKEDVVSIKYPNTGYFSSNILCIPNNSTIACVEDMNISCDISGFVIVKYVVTVLSSNYEYPFSVINISALNYKISNYDRTYNRQSFESIDFNCVCSCKVIVLSGKYKVDYYVNDHLTKTIIFNILSNDK